MLIVHIISGLEKSGAELMLFRLVKEMSGNTHIIVSLTSIGEIGKKLLDNGFSVYVFDFRGIHSIISVFRLSFFLRKIKPDILQTWMYHADLIGGVIGKLSGVTNVVWNIRSTKIPQKKYSLTGIFVLICAKLSPFIPEKIICCSHSSLKSHAQLGYSRDKLKVIQNGFEVNKFLASKCGRTRSRLLLNVPDDRFVVGMVGRFDPLKGYDIFVKAAGILTKDHPEGFLFMVAGREINKKNELLRHMIIKFAPNADFKLLGERDDIPDILQSLDVFCLASRSEGFPNVVAEAMLMQIPCVVTDVGDAREIVGASGIVVPAENPSALASAISAVFSFDDNTRIELGNSARVRIVEDYRIESIAIQYVSLYSSLVKYE
jgi:glycosyltransferase involved in cell wall biosynthesis